MCFPQAFVLALSHPYIAPQDKFWPRTPNPRTGLEKLYVHRSVKTWQDSEGLEGGEYKPKVQFYHLPVDIEYVE
jgi:hypothetical protein